MKKKLIKLLPVFILIFIAGIHFFSAKNMGIKIIVSGLANGNILPFKAKKGTLKGIKIGGLAQRSAFIKKLEKNQTHISNNIILDLGDNISGTPEAFYTKGDCIIDLLNHQKLTAMLLGNREFDYGQEVLKVLKQNSDFRFLASNIIKKDGSIPEYIVPYIIKTVGSKKVGIIGITPPNTPDVSNAKNLKHLVFKDAVTTLNEKTSFLKKKGADYIICITQNNISKRSMDFIQSLCVNGLDILYIITMDEASKDFFVLNNTYVIPLFRGNKGSQVIITDFLKNADGTKKIKVKRAIVISEKNHPDPFLSKKIIKVSRKIDSLMDKLVCEAEEDIFTHKMEESPLGNLICDILKEQTNTDISFQNSGGVQADLKKGPIYLRDMYKILPFDNEVITMNLTGKDIKDIITNSITKIYGLMQVSGLTYKFKKDKNNLNKIIDIKINGADLLENKKYSVVTNSFLASGGDKYESFKNGNDIKVHGSLRQAIIDGFKKKKKIKANLYKRISEVMN